MEDPDFDDIPLVTSSEVPLMMDATCPSCGRPAGDHEASIAAFDETMRCRLTPSFIRKATARKETGSPDEVGECRYLDHDADVVAHGSCTSCGGDKKIPKRWERR